MSRVSRRMMKMMHWKSQGVGDSKNWVEKREVVDRSWDLQTIITKNLYSKTSPASPSSCFPSENISKIILNVIILNARAYENDSAAVFLFSNCAFFSIIFFGCWIIASEMNISCMHFYEFWRVFCRSAAALPRQQTKATKKWLSPAWVSSFPVEWVEIA